MGLPETTDLRQNICIDETAVVYCKKSVSVKLSNRYEKFYI